MPGQRTSHVNGDASERRTADCRQRRRRRRRGCGVAARIVGGESGGGGASSNRRGDENLGANVGKEASAADVT
jgi:hypothetical protein